MDITCFTFTNFNAFITSINSFALWFLKSSIHRLKPTINRFTLTVATNSQHSLTSSLNIIPRCQGIEFITFNYPPPRPPKKRRKTLLTNCVFTNPSVIIVEFVLLRIRFLFKHRHIYKLINCRIDYIKRAEPQATNAFLLSVFLTLFSLEFSGGYLVPGLSEG